MTSKKTTTKKPLRKKKNKKIAKKKTVVKKVSKIRKKKSLVSELDDRKSNKKRKKAAKKTSNKKSAPKSKPLGSFQRDKPVPEVAAKAGRLLSINSGASRWLWLTLLVVLFDQWTKSLIMDNFNEFDFVTILPYLDFMRVHNTGAAFSILSDASGWQRWMFITLGFGISGVILVWIKNLPTNGQALLASSLSLIMGGALGNVIDRILWGHVVDFIRVHYEQWYFPTFNIADSAITLGAVLLILDSVLHKES
ncbi:MAG: hypothetical protein CMM56_06540 [Rhodospirillaceae bacterium]|nr:hypothetical protein [Rhodospirillaceae bacterium]|tara:strand:+ start:1691 stop:2443 length:753 start_codon:yes stop_codon:yes gene_type:complete